MSAPGYRVLLVVSESSAARAMEAALERRGHLVHRVGTAESAMRAEPHDVLVCDLAADGFELVARLAAVGLHPHTVFLADDPSLEERRDAQRVRAAILYKPFRLDDLVRAVESRRAPPAVHDDRSAEGAIELVYPSRSGAVEAAARDVAAYALRCGVRPATRARIATSASELVDNARRHGYSNGRGEIFVHAHATEREFVLSVRDDGLGFDTSCLSARLLNDTRQSGLARALALCEDMQITSAPGAGTAVRMSFAAHAVEFDDATGVDLCDLDFLTPDLARRVLHALKRSDTASLFRLSPALSVVVGRLISGAEPNRCLDAALWS